MHMAILFTGVGGVLIQQIYKFMGQQESRQQSLINNKNWRLVSEQENQVFHHINPYCNRALYNSFTNEYVEEYELQFTSEQDYLSYAKELELRKEPAPYELQAENSPENTFKYSPFIYKVKYFLNTSSQDLCSTLHKGLLYIQKVDLRLKEINDIPFADQLYLLQATLQGFKVLYEKVGYFDISEEMIFISCRGKVRVWMNPNLAKNLPYYVPRIHESSHLHGSQSEMIVNLINTIQQNTDIQNSHCIHFKQYLMNKGILDRLSFYKALEEFQLYCLQNRLIALDYMRSIYELYQDDVHHLSESRAEHSEVVRLETNREFNSILGIPEAHSNSKSHRRNFSPNLTTLKNSQYSGSQVSKKSYTSYKSMGEKQSRKNIEIPRSIVNQQIYRPSDYPFIPPLPINKSKGVSQNPSPRNQQNEISFGHPNAYDIFNNELSFAQIHHNSNIPSSRRTNFRNIRRNNEQIRNPPPQPMNPMVTFNYINHPQPSNIPEKTHAPNNLRTVNTMNSMSSFSAKETEFFFEAKSKDFPNKVTYHSPHHAYSLDNEIVEDLEKFLGFNVNQL